MVKKIRIAHLAGPNATITNTPPLVTSNKARRKYGLPLLQDVDGNASRFDVLRPQALAAPATLYVEQFSAHPLEADAAELYAPPDGFLNSEGEFSENRRSPQDRPVYKIEIGPDDGYYPLPYMARQANGQPWETDGASDRAPRQQTRQPFMPDGSRVFEEVDRLGIGRYGIGNQISDKADVDFFRIAPSGGYTKGLAAAKRKDIGEGDIAPEVPGKDFFPYRPRHLQRSPPRMVLARITNKVQAILASGDYSGAIWTQGSPRIEETMYWLNLVLDVTVPVCGNAAQRYNGMISNDGPKNLTDSVEYLASKAWADENGRDRVGTVLVQDQRVFASRDVMKADARPGGYVATGGHGGVVGTAGGAAGAVLRYVPVMRHTYCSEVNVTKLPSSVEGLVADGSGPRVVTVRVKNAEGELLDTAIPKVSIVKDASYSEDDYDGDPAQEVDIIALTAYKLKSAPLAGFVLEGLSPYGRPASTSRMRAMMRAAYTGFPVVLVGRGNTEGFSTGFAPFIGGSNLTATKARILLMLCIMKYGMLPPAREPANPTPQEAEAVAKRVKLYQAIFDTH
jgi:L-asparaginase